MTILEEQPVRRACVTCGRKVGAEWVGEECYWCARLTALFEDAEFLADTGETFAGAAERLGKSEEALQAALQRHGRHDLYRRLLRNGAAA